MKLLINSFFADFFEKLNKYVNTVSCKPRKVLVSAPETQGVSYHPCKFKIKQCGGCCTNNERMSCQPTKIVQKKIPVSFAEFTIIFS